MMPPKRTRSDNEIAVGQVEGADTRDGTATKRPKKALVGKSRANIVTTDDDGNTVIDIARPDDMSMEQELKFVAWLEDNEIIYNQSTKYFKNKAKKDRLFTEFGATIGLTGPSIDRWYKSMRSSYGRIKKDFQKSGSATPVLKYRAAWIWKHLVFLRPHVRNKTPGVIMSRGVLNVQEGEDVEEDSVEVMKDDDDANSTVSSVVSSAVPSQSSHKDSTVKASGSTAKVRSSSSKGSKSTLDTALSEYLRKTAPETANIQKEVQESLAALIQQRDHAAIWGSLSLTVPEAYRSTFSADSRWIH